MVYRCVMVRSSVGPVVAALTLGLSLSACVRDEKLPERIAKAWCDYLVECGEMASVSDCMDVNAYIFEDAYLEAAIEAGRIDYNGGKAYRCVRAIKKLKCERGEDVDAIDEACAGVYAGAVAPDEPCLRSEECVGEASVCAFVPGDCVDACCVGVCRFIPDDVAIGEPCNTGECAEGGYCSFSVEMGGVFCRAEPEVGEPCPDWVCAGEAACVQGTCTAPVKRGDPCDFDDRCEGTSFCEVSDGGLAGTCRERAKEGEPCLSDLACLRERDRCVDGTCQAGAEVGEACSNNYDCVGYAYCDGQRCVGFQTVGESCTEQRCYSGLSCESGTCENVLAEAGDADAECSPPE